MLVRLIGVSCTLAATSAHADEPPSPSVAVALSATPTVLGIGATIAGIAVANINDACTPTYDCTSYLMPGLVIAISGGVLVAFGPSLGHIYARNAWTTGLKVRLIGAGVIGVGALMLAGGHTCSEIVCPLEGLGILTGIGGALTVVVGASIDVATVRSAATPQLTVTALRTPSGTTPGLAFRASF